MKKIVLYLVLPLVVFFVAIQFVPVSRTNPAVTADLVASPEVKKILRTSCYDCHSNETKWPWYSRVAPISWLVAHDVKEGRSELNFSLWNSYNARKKKQLKADIWEEVEEGRMPVKMYLWTHSKGTLDKKKIAILEKWIRAKK